MTRLRKVSYKVNLESYKTIGTIEIRQHQGFENTQETLSWLNHVNELVEVALTQTRAGRLADLDTLEAISKNPRSKLRGIKQEKQERAKLASENVSQKRFNAPFFRHRTRTRNRGYIGRLKKSLSKKQGKLKS